ncbi:protein IMPACT-A-like isoform X1 [Daphnia pulicaria]|uniref:protein IMPACT-A-like isoform X1 n=1 Tax=Daphnia pulicaria TaxID=35523 RepID=UPI001EEBE842|nr:protein IMPACT-A-like isoform X1 [Daphnia pulicaria]XP_046652818.1 protein IMPACT-A-like isoform X2 [Daphnia pulicaria]XP_046652819.1 protein IMPACT-A-like isoform X1 [Daphnia pulicaria]XP_046652820.1 protein IMPACT-A-like isoform X1 [Daphnia pulicaria]XP_046652821.1 protein IMPACT-A-like isoform X1 [Daphnia pulicaria]
MENDDNLSKQMDEIEALSAIYLDEWKTEDEAFRTFSATITESGRVATLLITLPAEYPATSPPFYLLTAPWMKEKDRDEIYNQLEQIYLENAGESILHLWIEKFREHLQNQDSNVEKDVHDDTVPPIAEEIPNKFKSLDLEDSKAECPSIISADPFTERKSTFQGHAATVTNTSQVKLVLAKLYENRKIAQATHNIYAYRMYNEQTKMWIQDCDDDGETHAGGRLMHLLQILDVKNVIVVVSRWFGGILLGGDRFKLINNAARDALEMGTYIASAGSDDVTKKKSKKR